MSNPNNAPANSELYSVSAVSDSDVWAAGAGSSSNQPATLLEHWNGSAWSTTGPTFTGTYETAYYGIKAIATNNVWAVGYANSSPGPLLEHWDGSSWSNTTTVVGLSSSARLFSVDAISANDVWVAGEQSYQVLTLHWDGSTWSVIPTPGPSYCSGYLRGVSARAANDVWAVGEADCPQNQASQALIEHWDGTAWSIVANPAGLDGSTPSALTSVVAISANNAWATGYLGYLSNPSQALVLHWNGAVWSVVDTSSVGGANSELDGIAAHASNDIWFVGYQPNRPAYFLHWDGSSLSVVQIPGPTGNSLLYGVTTLASGSVWAVGRSSSTTNGMLALYRAPDPCATSTPTPTPVLQTATPTATGPVCTPAWAQSSATVVAQYDPSFWGMDARTDSDVWAVGDTYTSTADTPIAAHWDGAQWTQPGQAALNAIPGTLFGVAALASNNIWAAGAYQQPQSAITTTLMLHWDGSMWNTVSVPGPMGSTSSAIYSLSALSANDIWGVGSSRSSAGSQTFTVHYDGSTWSIVPSPSASETDMLKWVSALSDNDVWAVGWENQPSAPITEHWDGTSWSIVPVPSAATFGGKPSSLFGVKAISSNDVWAVGDIIVDPNASIAQGFILHWDGTTWSRVDYSDYMLGSSLRNIDATAANDVWAVGYGSDSTHSARTLIMHWDGASWRTFTDLGSSGETGVLLSVSESSASDVWIGGSLQNRGLLLHEHLNDCTTPTATPTNSATPTATHTIVPTSTPTPPCPPSWSQTVITSTAYTLSSVDAQASNNVWAVGGTVSNTVAVAMRWDGSQWLSPGLDTLSVITGTLRSVAAVSPNDVWALGGSLGAVHWDGTQWSKVAIPTPPGMATGSLVSLSATASDDVWAAGNAYVGAEQQTYIAHYDGHTWSIVPSPNPSTSENFLVSISADSPTDVWVTGYWVDVHDSYPLVEHWDGSAWSVVPVPAGIISNSLTSALTGVSALSPTDVWAVGNSLLNNAEQTLLLHWDGHAWTNSGQVYQGPYAFMEGVASVAPDNVWAVGYTFTAPSGGGIRHTLVEHYDGSTWNIMSNLGLPDDGDYLLQVSALPSGIWMTGNTPDAALLIHDHLNDCATPTATATSTATSTAAITATVTRTATQPASTATSQVSATPTQPPASPAASTTSQATVQATSTPTTVATQPAQATATATACAIHFEDVPAGSTFYPYVQCLACRGILSGYACGGVGEPCDGQNSAYFRPGSLITRGQISKVVSNSAGFSEAVSGRLFQDVPPGSPFYVWIGRLTQRGLMTGYACGGAGEPCLAGNLPYFRPNADATRGQIAKIVSNAAGFSEAHTEQLFNDVPANQPFYIWVARLASRNVMGGYSCGSPGEACDANHLPYFRPGSNATRGQVAKIVSGTFFSQCGEGR